MADGTFDPRQHLSRVNGKPYLEVKWRLVWLREQHPDAQLETELVKRSHDGAIFRALVTLPTGGRATGWGSETAGDFADYIEKAETKAIGRALLALGFGVPEPDDPRAASGHRPAPPPRDRERLNRAARDLQARRPGPTADPYP